MALATTIRIKFEPVCLQTKMCAMRGIGVKKLLMKPENYFGHNAYNTTKNDGNPVVQIFRKPNGKDFAAALKMMIYKLILKY